MRFKKLDLNLLVALDVMLKEHSISRAAERLHITQSAMSNALARLREYFEDDLLVQVGRKLELTPRAELLKDAVRDVLVRVDNTIAALPTFDPCNSDREFTICASDYTLATLIPYALQLASEQSATVRFHLLAQTYQPSRALERGETDLLIIPSSYCSQEHPAEIVFEEEFQCVVWSGSSRWASATSIGFDDYANAGHVAMRPPDGQLSFEGWFMQRFGVTRRVEVSTFNFSSLPFLVLGTDRIATVHARLARAAQTFLPVKVFTPPIPIAKMEQAMQWHKYRTNDPGIVWLRTLIQGGVQRMDSLDNPSLLLNPSNHRGSLVEVSAH
jgi:LysR family nod box-dependent transcriptional activator